MTRNPVVLDTTTIAGLVERFYGDDFAALLLVGSRARGSAGPHSDVDLLRLAHADATSDASTDAPRTTFPGDGSHMVDGWLVTVSTLTQARIDEIFTDPSSASAWIAGLRTAHMLVDPTGVGVRLQQRARDFVWDATMQSKANQWASVELVGLIEECHKGLEGVRRRDTGRLLNARFGLSWLLSHIVQVQRGVLLSGDNGVWDEINRAVGESTAWVRLRYAAFGIESHNKAGSKAGSDGAPPLHEQVVAGLHLYCATVTLLDPILTPPKGDMIRATVARIEGALGDLTDG